MASNPHGLPPCPICKGETQLGQSSSGTKIYCKNYAYCGGIIHNINTSRIMKEVARTPGAKVGIRSESPPPESDIPIQPSKQVDPAPQVCLSSPEEFILKFVDPFVTIQPEAKEDFKKVMGWDEKTFMSKVFVRLKAK